jgi:hypothetical protein
VKKERKNYTAEEKVAILREHLLEKVPIILIALTGGEIVWDAQLGDFDWRATTALPTIVKGAFKSERSAISVASFAAAITGQSLSDIVGEDVRQHRPIRRLALVMVLLFFSLSRCSFLFTRCFV